MRRRELVLLPVACALAACGDRWRPNTPRTLQFRDGPTAFETALSTLKDLGYQVRVVDPERLYLQAIAKLDGGSTSSDWSNSSGPVKLPFSFISLQAYLDGNLMITVHGHHVKEEDRVMHRKLYAEIEGIINALNASGHVVGSAPPGYAPPPPPPAAPPPAPPAPQPPPPAPTRPAPQAPPPAPLPAPGE